MCRPWSKRIDISCKYFEPQSGDHCVTGGRAASSAVQRSTKTAAMATGFKRADGGITIDDLSLAKRRGVSPAASGAAVKGRDPGAPRATLSPPKTGAKAIRVEIRAPVGGLF